MLGHEEAGQGEARSLSLLGLLADVLEHSRTILRITSIIVTISVTLAVLRPASYTARASFAAQESSAAMSRLGGMALQFGLGVPGLATSQSPQFYSDFLASPAALRALVLSDYSFDRRPFLWFPIGEVRRWDGTLAEYLIGSAPETEEDVVRASRKLRKRLSVSLARATGVVTFTVRDRSPHVALQVVQRGLLELDSLNLSIRQSAAGAERVFAAERADSARLALAETEDSLRQFLQRNRSFRDSPELAVQFERLQRNVALRQQVYVTLAQSLEQARIDEVRNTPTLTIVESPILPPKDRRRIAFVFAVALVGGVTLSLVWVLASVAFRSEVSRDPRGTERLSAVLGARGVLQWIIRRSAP